MPARSHLHARIAWPWLAALGACGGALGPTPKADIVLGAYLELDTGGALGEGHVGSGSGSATGSDATTVPLTGFAAEGSLHLVLGYRFAAVRPHVLAGMTIGGQTELHAGYGADVMVGLDPQLVALAGYDQLGIANVVRGANLDGSRLEAGLLYFYHTSGSYLSADDPSCTGWCRAHWQHWAGTRALSLRIARTSGSVDAGMTTAAGEMSTWAFLLGWTAVTGGSSR